MAGRHRRHDRNQTPTIAVLGSINMDLIVSSSRLPRPGETLSGKDFSAMQGGKGANQAIAAARAGARVRMIGAVGSDEFGPRLVGSLSDAGVDTTGLRRFRGPSGVALITVADDAENTIVVVSGANGSVVDLHDADRAAITGADMLVLQLEVPMAIVMAAAGVAAGAGVPVLLNPSPVQPLPEELLASVDILVVNETEAAALGAARPAGGHVVTTLGAFGARYRGPSGILAVPTPGNVRPVDTTGAGDAFAGALAVAWCRGDEPADALRWACAAGSLATTLPGAGASSPTAEDIEQLLGS